MSVNKLISIKNAIIDTIDDLGLDHSKNIPVFMRWAERAEKKIGSYYGFVRKHAVLDIHNCAACLPLDCAYLQRAVMGDQGCDCADLFNNLCANLSINTTSMNTTNLDLNSFLIVDRPQGDLGIWGLVAYELQDNKIVFNANYDGQKVTIQYLGVKTDCDGFLEVSENHIDAINEFCKFMYRSMNPRNGIQLGVARDHEQRWERLCADARATDGQPNESERQEITQLINDPWVGWGLSTGMFPTINWNNTLY